MKNSPNIIYIITDQQRYEHLGCNGELAKTPNIDELARNGVNFERFYTNSPICTPSRAAIITGRHIHSNRVFDNGCPLPDSELTLPAFLKQHGYNTKAVGKIHLTPWGDDSGTYFESGSYWDNKKDDDPEPYIGFDSAEICVGHISHKVGHYSRWLQKEHPDIYRDWKTFISPHPSGAHGTFSWTMPLEAHANSWIADRVCAYLEEQKASSDNQPFFLHVGFPDPHHAFRAPEPWGSMYNPDDMVLPNPSIECLKDKPPEYMDFMKGVMNKDLLGAGDCNTVDLTTQTDQQLKQIMATTLGMVSFIDQQVGRILTALKETGLDKNTVIAFTTDHGDLMGDHRMIKKGPFMLEGLVHVPMVISGPEYFQQGIRSDALAGHVDFFATICDLLGVKIPCGVEGKSFLPVLKGKGTSPRNRLLIEYQHQFMLDRNIKALVTRHWKIVYWGGQTYGELYDLKNDPGESKNLWDNQQYTEKKNELIHQLLDELVVTDNILPYPPAIF